MGEDIVAEFGGGVVFDELEEAELVVDDEEDWEGVSRCLKGRSIGLGLTSFVLVQPLERVFG